MTRPSNSLLAHAESLGVETSYIDSDGHPCHVSAEPLADVVAVLDADRTPGDEIAPPVVIVRPGDEHASVPARLERGSARLEAEDGSVIELEVAEGRISLPPLPIGVHRLRLDDAAGTTSTLLVAPSTMPSLGSLDRSLTLFCPGYALWSESDPAPSVAHLSTLARGLTGCDVELLAVLPLYAAFLDQPREQSPYSPVSRLHWNEAYLDPALLAEVAPGFEPVPVMPPADGERVDWDSVWRTRLSNLRAAADRLPESATRELEAFCAQYPDVTEYAEFRALTGVSGRPLAPGSATADPASVKAYELGQWLLDRSLGRLADDHAAAGLVLDLPVGCHADGFETWAHPELFASSMHVGAPPDTFFRAGQDWGFPPMLPSAGRRNGHDLWYRIVERAANHSAILRIDHIMGVHRLWWIPEGRSAADGVYVRYPARELLAAAAIAASRTSTALVGEDLGTVPPEIGSLMSEQHMLGMHEEQFTMVAGARPERIPSAVFAGVRTHDMPAFAEAANDPAVEPYARALGASDGDVEGLLDLMLERLAGSEAATVVVDLDDLMGEQRPHNTPGVYDAEGWSRRLALPVDRIVESPGVGERLRHLAKVRRAAAGDHS